MLIDDLVYSSYKGNQLLNVTDNSTNNLGYPNGGNTIGYDLNGNMINHVDKGITNISYNYLNLPKMLFSLRITIISNSFTEQTVKLKKAYTYYASKVD